MKNVIISLIFLSVGVVQAADCSQKISDLEDSISVYNEQVINNVDYTKEVADLLDSIAIIMDNSQGVRIGRNWGNPVSTNANHAHQSARKYKDFFRSQQKKIASQIALIKKCLPTE